MRKHDGGYVLVYVVFVIIFLCIAAAGTCTAALNNIKAQDVYVKRMQDKYAAESTIEKFMAEVCTACSGVGGSGFETAGAASVDAKAAIRSRITAKAGADVSCSGMSWDNNRCILTVEAEAGESKATAQIDLSAAIAIDEYSEVIGKDEEDNDITVTRYVYIVSGMTSGYLSYTLGTAGGGIE